MLDKTYNYIVAMMQRLLQSLHLMLENQLIDT